jgi:hypothetical protein
MKKLIIVFSLAMGQFFCKAELTKYEYDTIANWQIFYGKKLIAKGNVNGRVEYLIDTILYDSNSNYLTIHYNYDSVDPERKEIEIWEDKRVLTKEIFKEKPFRIDVQEILTKKTKNRIIKLKIFYWDNSINKKQLIGQLIFDYTRRPTFHYDLN